MGVFENFPYTNFHEMNLDWIVTKVKEVITEWIEYKESVDAEITEFRTWFDNLDVQDEVRVVINEMVASGEFLDVTEDTITSTVTAWLTEHITPTTPVVDDTLTISGAAADAKVTGDRIFDLKEDLDILDEFTNKKIEDFTEMTIEGYERTFEPLTGTVHDNEYFNSNSLSYVSLNGWEAASFDVVGGETYYISGTGSTGARLYVIVKSDGYISAPAGTGVRTNREPVTMPDTALRIIVNANKAQGHAAVEEATFNFVKEEETPIAIETSENNYSVYCDNGFVNKVNLAGSNNGLFNFQRLDNPNNTLYKTQSDDITPVYLQGDIVNENIGYCGANHGFSLAREYTFGSPHGLTNNDIGKIYTTSTAKYILIQVTSATKAVIGVYNTNLWYRLRPIVLATSFDFGTGTITAESNVVYQLTPSVKNGNVEILENSTDRFIVQETYDIIDIGVGIDGIAENVGNNNNSSFNTLADSAITIRNLYQFNKNGSVTIYQNLKLLKDYVKLGRYGGVQSQNIGSTDYFAVSQSTLKTPAAVSGENNFTRDKWDDATIPPMLYMQMDTNVSNMTKAFATGVIVDNRNTLLNTSAGFISSSKKMYPYAVQPLTSFNAGKTFNSISFRVPFIINQYSDDIKLASYFNVYDDIYLIIATTGAVDTSVTLPDELKNRKCEVIMTDTITCETEYIVDAIDVKSDGFGYMIARLYK